MLSEVHHIHKNMRYRIIKVDNTYYIFDLDRPFLVFFFPFLNWIKTHTIYEIKDMAQLEQLRTVESSSKIGFGIAMFTGGLSVFLANLLEPIIFKMEFQTPTFITYILLIIFSILVIFFRFKLSKKNKIKILNVVALSTLEKKRISVKPQSIKHFCLILFMYIIVLLFLLASIFMFIEFKNYFVLFSFILILFFLLIINASTLAPGKNKIKINNNKSAV
ncbi:DUF443 family protein [Paucisalibacillus globulus]|uniref:DUF443 family protein n=1 Tax=Paucisalibacillus globulus TaxID=351095 RepID=UPI0003F7EE8A|nr:DUF443 family protein [Paucisalibacillus globulus]